MSYNVPENVAPLFSGGLNLQNQGETTTYALKPPTGLVGDITLTLPPVVGEKDYILKTDGLGNLSWTIQGALSSQGSVKKLTLSAPAGLLTDITFTFPGTAGSAGNVLATDGAGGLSWVPQGGGGGGSVTGVFGTAGQIASSGGSAPVISLVDVAGLTPNPYAFPSSITVDAKGRVTAITGGSAPVTSVSGAVGQISVTGTTTPTVGLATVAGVAGSYTSANITVDSYGRVTVASNGTGGAGAPADAEYLVLTADGGLTNEKVLGLSSNLSSSTVGSIYTLDLANTAVAAGSYTYASITVDAKGRITAASSGTAPVTSVTGTAGQISVTGTTTPTLGLAATGSAGTYANPSSLTTDAYGRVTSITAGTAGASSSASYIVVSSEEGLSQERVLAVTSDLTKTDGLGGGNLTLGLSTTGVSANTYSNPSSVTVDDKGRISSVTSGVSALPTINTGLTSNLDLTSGFTSGIHYYGFDTKNPSGAALTQMLFNVKLPNVSTPGDIIYLKDETGAAFTCPIQVQTWGAGSKLDGVQNAYYTLAENFESVQLLCISSGNWVVI